MHVDLFNPTLVNSVTPHAATEEQNRLVGNILEITSSDSSSAKKAHAAIRLVLAGGALSSISPTVTSVEPNTKPAGSAMFNMKVNGTGFDATCKIYVNDVLRTTTFTSAIEVSTDISLVGVVGANIYPVVVINGAGVSSNTMIFTVTA